ncbi:hypothetical protein BHE74_00055222 [Ensete ventricosum]|nr:hypothetical protein BHE74_00055222 [Ensete ventricosum]
MGPAVLGLGLEEPIVSATVGIRPKPAASGTRRLLFRGGGASRSWMKAAHSSLLAPTVSPSVVATVAYVGRLRVKLRVLKSERERVFPPFYLLPKRVFYTCEMGAHPYIQPYLSRSSGCDRDVRRTYDYNSMRQGHDVSCYINGRGARQCHIRSSTSDNKLAVDLVPQADVASFEVLSW